MVCFDMDGVLVVYEQDAYVGDSPRYLQPGYFRNRKPDKKAIALFKHCLKMLPLDTFICTGVPADHRNRIILDKLFWLDTNIPEFDIGTRFIASSSMDKSALFEHIRMNSLNRRDVIIDDFNPRLYNWEMRGGTAIKYLNGINSSDSWNGPCIDGRSSDMPEQMFMQIMEAMSCR